MLSLHLLTLAIVALLLSLTDAFERVVLQTRTSIKSVDSRTLHTFLATPANWPRIVLSSSSVNINSSNDAKSTGRPMLKGEQVNEIFGLPPVLPLSITWLCEDSVFPNLSFRSASGVPGLASDCKMRFKVSEDETASVSLEMSYDPQSVLALLAIPALTLDNGLALKVLLPNALAADFADSTNERLPIDEFRLLMGKLYGGAGVAHGLDLAFGGSQLLTNFGLPPFQQLPPVGQALAVLWCVSGPVAFALTKGVDNKNKSDELDSTAAGRLADAGLVQYGLVEVGCAVLAASAFASSAETAAMVPNALFVQALVALSWGFSNSKQSKTE
jgi:hypothetical protein